MANVRFNLKNRNETETLISVWFRYDGKRLVYSTGQKINPKFWNDKEQKARETAKFPEYPEFNAYLKKIETEVLNIYRRSKIDAKPLSVAGFKKELDKVLKKVDKDQPQTLFEFIDAFIKIKENSVPKPKAVIELYNKAYKHLKDFALSKRRKIDFQDIDLNFLDEYTNYLYSLEKPLSTNYASKLLQTLKFFLNEATERGYNKNTNYQSKKFSIKREDTEHIYLTNDEIKKIANLDLSENKRLDKVRDLFLIGCKTGLRFSDFSSLKKEHFKKVDGIDIIELVTQKTKEKVVIPIHPIVKSILKKYNGKAPNEISNQKMNEYLKELGELAEINEVVTKSRTNGGVRIDETFKKYELISTHVCRRSFATNTFKAGISSINIMKITGHTSEKSFLRYIKITGEQNATMMAKNSFFID